MYSALKAELLDRLNILVIKKPAPYSSLFQHLGRVGPKHPLQTSVAFGVAGGHQEIPRKFFTTNAKPPTSKGRNFLGVVPTMGIDE